MLGKIEGKREKGVAENEMVSSITDLIDMNLSKLWEIVRDRVTWRAAVHGVRVRHDLATEQQQGEKRLDSSW